MKQKIHQSNRLISFFLMLLMVFSVLQICTMPMAAASLVEMDSVDQGYGHHVSDVRSGIVEVLAHSCCPGSEQVEMNSACKNCDNSDELLKVSSPDTLKPLFSLLYLTFQGLLTVCHETRFWQVFIEPDILVSRPAIYLEKVSFLE